MLREADRRPGKMEGRPASSTSMGFKQVPHTWWQEEAVVRAW